MAEISKVRFGGVDYDIKSITDTTLAKDGTPADAAVVGNKIETANKSATIKAVINDLAFKNQESYIIADWENGAIKSADGEFIDQQYYQYRIRTHNLLYFKSATTYHVENGYSAFIFIYNSTGEFISFGGETGQNNDLNIPADSYCRFMIRKVPDDQESVADVVDFVTHVRSGVNFPGYLRTDSQDLSEDERFTVVNNIGTDAGASMFADVFVSENLYNPSLAQNGRRIDTSNGNIVTDTNYNLYKLAVPSGKTVVVTGLVSGAVKRAHVASVRSNVVKDPNGNILSSNTSSATAGIYSNTTENDVYVYFNIWSKTNANTTVDDIMMRLFDNGTAEANYITPYVPFGIVRSDVISNGVSPQLHNPRDIFRDMIASTVDEVIAAQENINYTFAFITDTHFTPGDDESYRFTADTFSNVKRISELVPLNAVIHGGDMVSVGWGGENQFDTNRAINMMRGWMLESNVFGNVFMTPGNHDGINGGPTPTTGLYGVMMTHNAQKVERIGNSYNYFYDIAVPNLRVIMLSDAVSVGAGLGVDPSGIAWVENVLDSTGAGTNVMIVSHIGPQSEDFTVGKADLCELLNSWNGHSGKYSNNTGKIIAWIAGHQHYDWIVPTSESGCNFPVILCTCSFRNSVTPSAEIIAKGAENVSDRTKYAPMQDSWTIFVYRPDIGKIKLIRFGAGNSKTIDYSNWDTSN